MQHADNQHIIAILSVFLFVETLIVSNLEEKITFKFYVMTTKVDNKDTKLAEILAEYFAKKMNLARIKFLGMFTYALCKVQTVGYEKLASAFEVLAKYESSLRRIQRFRAESALDTALIARLLFKLLPHKPHYRLALERTSWKFGEVNISVLTLAEAYQGVACPLLIAMLPKGGSSNTQERVDIMERYIRLFGRDTIEHLLADREFVGDKWIKYLNDYEINYHIRIRENFYAYNPRSGKRVQVWRMFSGLRCGECWQLQRDYYVNGQRCFLTASKVKDKHGVPELQIVISRCRPENVAEHYKERWQIEAAFRALKTSGFNIEATHLSDVSRIEKLFSLTMVAFVWAYLVGIYLHESVKQIKVKKHGNKAKSFFKYGLQVIANVLLNPWVKVGFDVFYFLSCT
jgi:hypothetical protein